MRLTDNILQYFDLPESVLTRGLVYHLQPGTEESPVDTHHPHTSPRVLRSAGRIEIGPGDILESPKQPERVFSASQGEIVMLGRIGGQIKETTIGFGRRGTIEVRHLLRLIRRARVGILRPREN